jgi:hypothetical protein
MPSRIATTVAILLVAVPLLSMWTIEIALVSGPHSFDCRMFGGVSSGLVSVPGCAAYHLAMYIMFACTGAGSWLLIRD